MDITLKVALNGSRPLCIIECVQAILLSAQPCNIDAGAFCQRDASKIRTAEEKIIYHCAIYISQKRGLNQAKYLYSRI